MGSGGNLPLRDAQKEVMLMTFPAGLLARLGRKYFVARNGPWNRKTVRLAT